MPRIEIELTSSRPDGSWTWRAAGARQPKGALDGSLLPDGSKVGEVMRAEVVVDVDGMTVTSVAPIKGKKVDSNRLEIIGPPQREQPAVTVDRPERGSRDGGRPSGRDGRDRDGRDGRDSRDGRRDMPRRDRDRPDRGGDRPPREGDRLGGAGPRRERSGPSRPPGQARPARPPGGTDRPERSRPPRERAAARPAAAAPPPPKPRPKRLHAGRAHRDAVLASLPPEQRPIAEHVLRGGVPAVRQALDEQNAAARAAGTPEVPTDALLTLAEGLLPRLRAAEWRDRADAAIAQVDEIGLRDLRALVVGSDAAGRDEESRELAGRLRQALEERSTKERDAWLGEINEALDAGRVVRALRSSCRPPEPGVRFPPDLAERLSTAASEAMAPDVAPDRWAAVLEAVTASPVRRMVKPVGLPEPPGDLLHVARQAADRVPGLGPLVGAPPPPAIGTRRSAPPPRPPRPPRPAPDAAAAAPPAAAPSTEAEPSPAPQPATEAATPAPAAPATEAAAPSAPAATHEPVIAGPADPPEATTAAPPEPPAPTPDTAPPVGVGAEAGTARPEPAAEAEDGGAEREPAATPDPSEGLSTST